MTEIGLYIHIPFCQSKCFYCSFASWSGKSHLTDDYLKALFQEMEKYRGSRIYSIYVGGGTPTFLSSVQLESLFNKCFALLDIQPKAEITIEVNPGTVDSQKMRVLKNLGVNRLSLGLQSADNNLLIYLGRIHTYENFLENYYLAREIGFTNINADLIYGISNPPSSPFTKGGKRGILATWQQTLEKVVSLSPEHLSLYPLSIEEGSIFFQQASPFAKGGVGGFVDEDLAAEMFEYAMDKLEKAGYEHYEIANFSRPGLRCRHNQLYWENKEYLGLGAAACSYLGGRRLKNEETIENYCLKISSGENTVVEEVILSAEKRRAEEIILKLRLKEGVAFSTEEEKKYSPLISRFSEYNLLIKTGDRWCLTRRGILLANCVFREFL